jgi:hypothetical protein
MPLLCQLQKCFVKFNTSKLNGLQSMTLHKITEFYTE